MREQSSGVWQLFVCDREPGRVYSRGLIDRRVKVCWLVRDCAHVGSASRCDGPLFDGAAGKYTSWRRGNQVSGRRLMEYGRAATGEAAVQPSDGAVGL